MPKQVDWALFDRLFARSPEAAALARDMMGDRDADAGREADMARIGGYLDELLPMLPTITATLCISAPHIPGPTPAPPAPLPKACRRRLPS